MTLLRKFQFKSIQSKLIVSFLTIAMLPLLVICYTAYATTNRQLINSSGVLLQSIAKQTLDKIYRNLFERYGDVQAFAFNPQARGDAAELTAALNFYTKTYGCYDLMLVADADGKVIAANTLTFDGGALDSSWLIGQSVRGETWFEKGATGPACETVCFAIAKGCSSISPKHKT